jgi:UV DNA damage endonuclease
VNDDGLSVGAATELALFTWSGREPIFHVSSPLGGWEGHGGRPQRHADYIDPHDLPRCWEGLELTVDVEAKAKELAVLRLMEDLGYRATWRRKKSANLRR